MSSVTAASGTNESQMVVRSMLIWDGGSRMLQLQKGDLSPLLIVFLNPTREKGGMKSVLCGSSKDALIVVPPKSMLEQMISDQLLALGSGHSSEIMNDIRVALQILSNRETEWPRWMGTSSVDEVRSALDRDMGVGSSTQ